jgi:CRISPR/Cas system-associated protein Cas10 (large subunit of type III CRISPR-Cas system)
MEEKIRRIKERSDKELQSKLIELQELVNDLYWEYDRMSSDGKDTLDNISNLLDIPTEETEWHQGKKWLKDGVYP